MECGISSFPMHFNPLPPCGGRRILSTSPSWITDFNPLPPCGGRPDQPSGRRRSAAISIHSLRVEGDYVVVGVYCDTAEFQSTPSVWRETVIAFCSISKSRFQSTPSVWRETAASVSTSTYATNFNPLPPCGGRPRGSQSPSTRRETICGADQQRKRPAARSLPPHGGRQQNCTAFRLKLSRANAILTKKNTDTLLHVRKNTFFLIFLRKSRCESLLLFLCA